MRAEEAWFDGEMLLFIAFATIHSRLRVTITIFNNSSTFLVIETCFEFRDNKHDEIVPCNEGCNCDVGSYSPVCGDDGVTYLSGCFAGCLDVNTSQETNEQISTLHRVRMNTIHFLV